MPMTPVVVIFSTEPTPRSIAFRVCKSLRRAGYTDLSESCSRECDACQPEEIVTICARYVSLYGLPNHKST